MACLLDYLLDYLVDAPQLKEKLRSNPIFISHSSYAFGEYHINISM
jgi:hypothetical protein